MKKISRGEKDRKRGGLIQYVDSYSVNKRDVGDRGLLTNGIRETHPI